jgi:hypothetical protein
MFKKIDLFVKTADGGFTYWISTNRQPTCKEAVKRAQYVWPTRQFKASFSK